MLNFLLLFFHCLLIVLSSYYRKFRGSLRRIVEHFSVRLVIKCETENYHTKPVFFLFSFKPIILVEGWMISCFSHLLELLNYLLLMQPLSFQTFCLFNCFFNFDLILSGRVFSLLLVLADIIIVIVDLATAGKDETVNYNCNIYVLYKKT